MKYIKEFHDLMDKYPRRFGKEMKNTRRRVEEFIEKYDHNDELIELIINYEEATVMIETASGMKPIKLTPFQKYQRSVVLGFFGNFDVIKPNESGELVTTKEYRRVCLEVFSMLGTGSGKSTDLSSMMLMFNELGILGKPEMYIGSCSFQISKGLILKIEEAINRSNGIENEYSFSIKSDGKIVNESRMSKIKAMSKEGDNFEGIEMAFLVIDEVHLFKDPEYINNMKKNRTKNPNMLTYEITTNGFVRGKYLDNRLEYLRKINSGEIENDDIMIFIFENDNEDEVIEAYYKKDYDVLYKSNPNAGYSQSLETIISAVKDALDDESKQSVLFAKHCNIPQTEDSIYFTASECQTHPFDESLMYGRYCFIGLDVAYTTNFTNDLTAITFRVHDLNDDSYYHLDQYFLPKHYLNEKGDYEDMIALKSKYDGIDYAQFIEDGYVTVIDNHEITEQDILDYVIETLEKYEMEPLKFGLDPNKASILKSTVNGSMKDPKFCLDYRSEQTKLVTPAIENVKEIRRQKKVYCNNKLTEMHFAQTNSRKDKNGYILLTNQAPARKDGVIAHMACERAEWMWNQTTDTNGNSNFNHMKEYWESDPMEVNNEE